MAFTPKFEITPLLTKILMDIEASRQAVSSLPITVKLLESLRQSARLTATHYSTQIEGNRLTQQQVEEVMLGGTFPNRVRDEKEVKHYYKALEFVDELIKDNHTTLKEKDLKTIHGLVMSGRKKATNYRDGQNVIKDSSTGSIVYMPPESDDVSQLMSDMLDWVNHQKKSTELPVPIIAAIAHYQYATIHPYYDGNGRTARLLTNLILHKSGYGLKGIYSLEEYYARNLQNYYNGLTIGTSHNYYMGREDADITKWILYFCEGMADAFASVRIKASEASKDREKGIDQSLLLRELDQRQKQVLSLFKDNKYIKTKDIARELGLHSRSALNICKKWVEEGFLYQHGTSNKTRKYELSDKWLILLSDQNI